MTAPPSRDAFITAHTTVASPPLVPEIRLHLATEITPLWEASEAFLEIHDLPPPFWAFAWAGGQALARYFLDHPETVRDKTVFCCAAGGGIDAIAAALAGAKKVYANDIDPVALDAIRLNAALNGVNLTLCPGDQVGTCAQDWDVVVAGDICYEKAMSTRLETWFRGLITDHGLRVITADPGRTYQPRAGLTPLATYDVPTSLELEDRLVRVTTVCEWTPLHTRATKNAVPDEHHV